jgi:WD40 repeat protein
MLYNILIALAAVAAAPVLADEPLPDRAVRRFGTTRFRLPGGVVAAALSPDGSRLAAYGERGVVRYFDTATGEPTWTVAGLTAPKDLSPGQRPVAVSPDGKRVAAGDGRAVRLLDAATGAAVKRLDHGQTTPWTVLFADPDRLYTADGRTVRLWNLAADPPAVVAQVACSGLVLEPAGDGLLTADPKTNRVAERAADLSVERGRLSLGGPAIRAAAGPGGAVVGVAREDHALKLTADGRESAAAAQGATWTRNTQVSALAVRGDGDRRAVLFGTTSGELGVWTPAAGPATRQVPAHAGWVTATLLGPDGRTLYTAATDGVIRRWDADTLEPTPLGPADVAITRFDLSADGKTLATAGKQTAAHLWDFATGTRRHALPHPAAVWAVGLSADGRTLATGDREPAVRLWDTESGKPTGRLAVAADALPARRIARTAFAPDGNTLIAVNDLGGTVRGWDVATATPRYQFDHPSAVAVAVSPDGRTVATGGFDRTIRVTTVDKGQFAGATLVPPKPMGADTVCHGLAFSPDGSLLASAHTDGRVRVWALARNAYTSELEADAEAVWSVAFSPDGRYLAVGRSDGAVGLWDVDGRTELRRLAGHGGWVRQVGFSRDGRRLVSASDDTTALVWEVAPASMPAGTPAELWGKLGDREPKAADAAVWALAARPADAVALAGEKLVAPPAPPADPGRVAALIADLDAATFATREAATAALAKLGRSAAPALRAAQTKGASPEAQTRLARLLGKLDAGDPADATRGRRLVAALERVATPAARAALKRVADADLPGGVSAAAAAASQRLTAR